MRSEKADVDQGNTHQWLRSAGLKAETEGFIMAAQDQSLFTRNYQYKIIKMVLTKIVGFVKNSKKL